MLKVQQISVLTDNYIYLIHDTESKQTVVIDPALTQPVLHELNECSWTLNYIFNTHHHGDHIGGNIELKAQTACKIVASKVDARKIPGVDMTVKEGDTLKLGKHTISILETCGHTLGHICFYFVEAKLLFCGDTLFPMGCGRIFEGTPEQMWLSLTKLKQLDKNTLCYCAHEYSLEYGEAALNMEPENEMLKNRVEHMRQRRARDISTVPFTLKDELETNPFLRADTKELQIALSLENKSVVEVFTAIRYRNNFSTTHDL